MFSGFYPDRFRKGVCPDHSGCTAGHHCRQAQPMRRNRYPPLTRQARRHFRHIEITVAKNTPGHTAASVMHERRLAAPHFKERRRCAAHGHFSYCRRPLQGLRGKSVRQELRHCIQIMQNVSSPDEKAPYCSGAFVQWTGRLCADLELAHRAQVHRHGRPAIAIGTPAPNGAVVPHRAGVTGTRCDPAHRA